jgi:transcriptional regulator with XRE-family HTH domain
MNNLKALRLHRELSQDEICRKLGINVVTYNRIERGWFTRAPAGVEEALKRFLGEEWTFCKLMEKPPAPRPDTRGSHDD